MSKSGVIDRDLGWKDIKKEIESLSKMGVKVGILEGTETKDGANVAEYAYYNEVGTEHIPSRPFLRSAVDNNQERINKMMDFAFRRVANGKWNAVDAMKSIGENGVSIVQGNIRKGSFVPDAPETIKRKIRAGKKGNQVLIDESTMRKSVNYEVVKDGQSVCKGEIKK